MDIETTGRSPWQKKAPLADGAIAPTPETTRPFGFASAATRGPAPLMSSPTPSAPVAPVAPQGVQGTIGVPGSTPYTPEPMAKPGLMDRTAGAVSNWVSSQKLGPGQTVPLQDTFSFPGSSGVTPGATHAASTAADYAAAPRGLTGAQAATMPPTSGMGPSFPAPAAAPQQAIVDAHTTKPSPLAAATQPTTVAPVPTASAAAPVARNGLNIVHDRPGHTTITGTGIHSTNPGEYMPAEAERRTTLAAAQGGSQAGVGPGPSYQQLINNVNNHGSMAEWASARQALRNAPQFYSADKQLEGTKYSSDNQLAGTKYHSDSGLKGIGMQIGEQGRQFDKRIGNELETQNLAHRDSVLNQSGFKGDELEMYRTFSERNPDPETGKLLHEMNRKEQLEAAPRMKEYFILNKKLNRGIGQYGPDASQIAPKAGEVKVDEQRLSDVNRSGFIRDWTPFEGLPDITSTRNEQGEIEQLGLWDFFKGELSGRNSVLRDSQGRMTPLGRAYRAEGTNGRIDNMRLIKTLRGAKGAPE